MSELSVGFIPDFLRRVGFEQIIDAERAAEFKVRPVEERVAERLRHSLGPRLKLFSDRACAGDQIF